MQTSRRASIESQLAGLAKRREKVRGELAEQAEKIAARAQLGKPASARMLARHEEMRAAYASIQRRHELLRAKCYRFFSDRKNCRFGVVEVFGG